MYHPTPSLTTIDSKQQHIAYYLKGEEAGIRDRIHHLFFDLSSRDDHQAIRMAFDNPLVQSNLHQLSMDDAVSIAALHHQWKTLAVFFSHVRIDPAVLKKVCLIAMEAGQVKCFLKAFNLLKEHLAPLEIEHLFLQSFRCDCIEISSCLVHEMVRKGISAKKSFLEAVRLGRFEIVEILFNSKIPLPDEVIIESLRFMITPYICRREILHLVLRSIASRHALFRSMVVYCYIHPDFQDDQTELLEWATTSHQESRRVDASLIEQDAIALICELFPDEQFLFLTKKVGLIGSTAVRKHLFYLLKSEAEGSNELLRLKLAWCHAQAGHRHHLFLPLFFTIQLAVRSAATVSELEEILGSDTFTEMIDGGLQLLHSAFKDGKKLHIFLQLLIELDRSGSPFLLPHLLEQFKKQHQALLKKKMELMAAQRNLLYLRRQIKKLRHQLMTQKVFISLKASQDLQKSQDPALRSAWKLRMQSAEVAHQLPAQEFSVLIASYRELKERLKMGQEEHHFWILELQSSQKDPLMTLLRAITLYLYSGKKFQLTPLGILEPPLMEKPLIDSMTSQLIETGVAREETGRIIEIFGSSRHPTAIFDYVHSAIYFCKHDQIQGERMLGNIRIFIYHVCQGSFQAFRREHNSSRKLLLPSQCAIFEEDYQQWIPGHRLASDGDHWEDLFLCGVDFGGSCQDVKSLGQFNQGLMGYCLDGKNRILTIKNHEGKMITRAIIRLMYKEIDLTHFISGQLKFIDPKCPVHQAVAALRPVDELIDLLKAHRSMRGVEAALHAILHRDGMIIQAPVLFLEAIYPMGCQRQPIIDLAVRKADLMGVELYISYQGPTSTAATLFALPNISRCDYSDAAESVITGSGAFRHRATLLK